MFVLALIISATCPPGTVDVTTTYSSTAGRGALPTGAGDHLQPVERFSVVAVPALERVLAAAPPTRTLQMMVVGAYGSETEYAVYVEGTQAVAVRQRTVLDAEGAAAAEIPGSEIATAWAPLDPELLARLEALWADALANRKQLDLEQDDARAGASYRFSRWQFGVEKAGQIRAPREDTPAMSALVDVGNALLAYASSSGERREPMLASLRAEIANAQTRIRAPGCIPVPVVEADCKTGGKKNLPVVTATSKEQFGTVWPRLPPASAKPVEVVLLVDDGAPTEQCVRVKVKRGIGASGHEHAFGFGTGLAMHDVIWTLVKARGRGENPVLVIP